jgi:hypothetical protein
MKLSNAKSYPLEGMSLIYANGENVVYQAIFSTEKFGTFTRVNGQWLALSPEDTSLENLSIMDILPADYKVVTDMFDTAQKAKTYLKYDQVKNYEVAYSFEESGKSITAAVETSEGCPPATSDIAVNLKNREGAIKTAGYGPMNPALPNNKFWQAKADRWTVPVEDAKKSLCGNCAVFIQTPKMLDCIASGLGNEAGNDAWGSIEAGDLGYCEAFDFKCAASRTCDAWVAGGPVTEESGKV